MKSTTPSAQADISACLQAIFQDYVRAVSSPVTSPEIKLYCWTSHLHQLRKCLVNAEAGVDLAAAFEAAVQSTTTHEPQGDEIEAQLDVGRMGIRHLIELASGDAMVKSRTAASETNLRGALRWLSEVRASSTPISKPDPADPEPVPASLTPHQAKAESDLAFEIAELFRETLRSISADDRRGAMVKVLGAFQASRNLANRIDHSYYYYEILEVALDQFDNPEDLPEMEARRLDVARAGVRLLATVTNRRVGNRGYASRRVRDIANFDDKVAGLNELVAERLSGGS